MGAPVVHFEIMTSSDAAGLQGFYADTFGWEIDANNPMNYGLVRTGAGTGIDGGIGPAQEGQAGHLTFYVEVGDINASLEKIESLGGKTLMPRTEIPDQVTIALFQDPAGNMVGLLESGSM